MTPASPHPPSDRAIGSAASGAPGEQRAAGGGGGARTFPKPRRLLKHADFDRVYRQGRRHFGQNMTVFWLTRSDQDGSAPGIAVGPGPRVGFTVGRVLGGAVLRNRIKRRMREAARLNLQALGAAVDVVINPKKSAATVEFQQLVREVEAAFAAIEAVGKRRK